MSFRGKDFWRYIHVARRIPAQLLFFIVIFHESPHWEVDLDSTRYRGLQKEKISRYIAGAKPTNVCVLDRGVNTRCYFRFSIYLFLRSSAHSYIGALRPCLESVGRVGIPTWVVQFHIWDLRAKGNSRPVRAGRLMAKSTGINRECFTLDF